MSAATDAVVELERRFWRESNNAEFLRHNFAEDGLTVFEPAGTFAKPQVLELAAQEKPWIEVDLKDVDVRELAPNCVVLTYRGSGRREGEAEVYRARVSSVYLHRQGRWQLGFTTHQTLSSIH